MDWNYEEIKARAEQERVKTTDLIALAPANDPFYAGTPRDRKVAEWFADLWRTFGYSSGVHVRRVHYQIVSQHPRVRFPDGLRVKDGDGYTDEYVNTEECWSFLTQAAKMARYLRLVDPGAFRDARNPPVTINAERASAPYIDSYDYLWSAPSLPDFPRVPQLNVNNYHGDQRYLLEIWSEKSTMNDVLMPLCRRYGANYQTGLGELSITAVLSAVQRATEMEKPLRIFYVSDFDPAGKSMPVAVSRKLEYFLRTNGLDDLDVRLIPVVLTQDQVRMFNLPRTPIKSTERRGASFEKRFGSGAVELDALEALHPGQLVALLEQEMSVYYDHDLAERVLLQERALESALARVRRSVQSRHEDAISALRARYDDIRARLDAEISGYSSDLRELWTRMRDEMEQEAPDIADYPVPEAERVNEYDLDEPLFDSTRDYMEQLQHYKAFQGKDAIELDGDV